MDLKLFKWIFLIILLFIILIFYLRLIPLFGSKFYKHIKEIKNPNDIKVLVNKNRCLSPSYIPNNLVKLKTTYAFEDKYLRKEAAEALEKLIIDSKKLNFDLVVVSAYRSYDYQQKLYHQYVKEKGQEYADACSARPGHSEHQTGLSFDIMGSNKDYDLFEEAIEFPWMKNNAYKYGFILRYPKGKEHITGFKYEPWHYRYVGKLVAKEIFLQQLTLEEYYEKKNH